MLTSRFGALERNSNWNQHVRLLQSPRALPPDEPFFSPKYTRVIGIRWHKTDRDHVAHGHLSLWDQSRVAEGRLPAALPGLGPWAGARVASPRCPILRPGTPS